MDSHRDEPRLSVRPEPSQEEREALERALTEARARAQLPARSGWWREGVRENAGDPSLAPPP